MLTVPGYVSKAADFMRSTGLIGQYQALDNDQQQGIYQDMKSSNEDGNSDGGSGDCEGMSTLHTENIRCVVV